MSASQIPAGFEGRLWGSYPVLPSREGRFPVPGGLLFCASVIVQAGATDRGLGFGGEAGDLEGAVDGVADWLRRCGWPAAGHNGTGRGKPSGSRSRPAARQPLAQRTEGSRSRRCRHGNGVGVVPPASCPSVNHGERPGPAWGRLRATIRRQARAPVPTDVLSRKSPVAVAPQSAEITPTRREIRFPVRRFAPTHRCWQWR